VGVGLIYGCLTPHPPIAVPAVAGARADQVRQTREAMKQVAREIRELSPDTLVLISPHGPLNPYAMGVLASAKYQGSFGAFGAPSVRLAVEGDPALASAIAGECRSLAVPLSLSGRADQTHMMDHGATVPLYFFQEAGVCSRLVLATFSGLDVETHLRFGRAISAAAASSGQRVALVASGDFSHRLSASAPAGYSPRGREFDEAIVSGLHRADYGALERLDDSLVQDAGECGYRSLLVALGALPRSRAELLSYEGPFGVGYLVARFLVEGAELSKEPPEQEAARRPTGDELAVLELARRAVESYIREGRVMEASHEVEGLLAERAGVFVSLHRRGDLRGCIGTFEPTEPSIAAEIIRNGIAAATRDPRFSPVAPEELAELHYSVDILSKPEPVSGPDQLDPKEYGVIVQSWGRRGLLLPDLAGVSTVEDQVSIARRKAGIPPGVALQLYRFTVTRIGEPT